MVMNMARPIPLLLLTPCIRTRAVGEGWMTRADLIANERHQAAGYRREAKNRAKNPLGGLFEGVDA